MNHPKGQTHRADVANSKPVLSKGEGSPELYRLLFAAASGAILVLQNGGESGWQVVECNAGAAGLLGYERENLLGQGLLAFCPPTQPDGRDSAELLASKIAAALAGESQRFEWLCRRGDQAEFDAHLALSALEFEDETLLQVSLQDISSYKQAQAELRRLAQAVEQSANTVVITDTRGYIQYANPKFTETTGYTLEEALGQHTRILKSGETSPEEYKALWTTISAGQEWRGEFHNKKKNGELYWELASISPIRDQNGIITHFLAVKEDVTARKEAEVTLARERQLLRTLIDNVPDYIYVKDTNSRFLIANNAVARQMGAAGPEELIGQTDFDFYPEQLAAQYYADEQAIIHSGQPLIDREEQGVDPAGREMWYSTTKVPLRDEHGRVIGLVGIGRDVTERKRAEAVRQEAEEVLREAEARYSAVVEQSRDGIVIIQDNLCQFVNQALADMLGYAREEVENSPFINYLAPESRELVAGRVKARLAGEEVPPVYEAKLLRKDGTTFEAELSAGVIQYRGQVADVGVIRDISRRKWAEEAVRESRQMLQLIMDNIPQSIFWKNKELIYLGCNQNFARDAGLDSADEVIGKTDYEMPWLDQAELYRADDRRVMEAGEPVLNYEEPQTTPAGNQIWLRTSKVPLHDAGGNVMAVLGMYEDVTERKQIEVARQESEQRLADIIDFLPTPTFVIDREGNVMAWNQAIAEVTGVKAEDILGKGNYEYALPFYGERRPLLIDLVFEPEEEVTQKYMNVRREGNSLVAENRVFPRGIERHYLLSAAPLYDAQGNLVGAIENFRDITEQKRAEAELRQYQDQLEELVAARTTELEERVRELNALQRLMSREGWQEYQAARRQAAPAYLFDQMAVRPVARTELALPGNGQPQTEPTGDSRTAITPLAVSGEKIGALGVYNNDPAQPLSAEDQAFLEAVAGQVAEALERARLLEQSRMSLAEAEQLYQAGRRLTEAGSLPEILAAVMEVGSIPVINRTLLFTFERDSAGEVETMTVAANWHSGVGTPPTPVGTRYSKEMLTALNFVLASEPVFVADPEQDERIDPATRAILQRLNIRSVAAIPLWVGARQVGSLLLEAEEAHHFSEQEIRLNLSLADQAAVAIDNQRLLQETQAALAEVEATQRRYTLQAWESYRAKRTAAASYEQTREGVPPLGEERLAELGRMRPPTARLSSPKPADGGPPQVDHGEASLIVPLTVRETVIGLLGLQATAERDWTPAEVALVEAVAEQVAQAAENLRLFDETQQRAAREKRVAEIGDKIRAAQSLEEALQVAIKEVGLSLKAPQTMVQLEVE